MAFRPPRVYPLTDRRLAEPLSHADQVERLVQAGMRLIQVRDKEMSAREQIVQLDAAVDAGVRGGALLVANDRPDLARLAGAGGVHLGADDLPVSAARDLLGPAAVIGRSSHDVASALAAEQSGADYVAFGPIYATETKQDARRPAGLNRLREVRAAIRAPLVAIGGITLERAAEVLEAGADSVAVIRDLVGAGDLEGRAAAWGARFPAGEYARRGLLFLTGFMGAGKTAVGEILAERFDRRFVDLDAEVEAAERMTVAEVFARRGEAAFRGAEDDVLASIPRGADAVVALGGGTLMEPRNARRVLGLGTLAWIDCPLAEALARCGAGSGRPLLQGKGAAAEALALRLPGYRRAHLRVDSEGRAPEEVAAELYARLVDEAGRL
jgi:thiamine-phosphate diphosphorylase